jgi:hypothetical protein
VGCAESHGVRGPDRHAVAPAVQTLGGLELRFRRRRHGIRSDERENAWYALAAVARARTATPPPLLAEASKATRTRACGKADDRPGRSASMSADAPTATAFDQEQPCCAEVEHDSGEGDWLSDRARVDKRGTTRSSCRGRLPIRRRGWAGEHSRSHLFPPVQSLHAPAGIWLCKALRERARQDSNL